MKSLIITLGLLFSSSLVASSFTAQWRGEGRAFLRDNRVTNLVNCKEVSLDIERTETKLNISKCIFDSCSRRLDPRPPVQCLEVNLIIKKEKLYFGRKKIGSIDKKTFVFNKKTSKHRSYFSGKLINNKLKVFIHTIPLPYDKKSIRMEAVLNK